ncbi:MAG TPA: hypothetical protein VNJ08_02320 [Bacteriovoracaceae bacterium]|nr:hypothetical protein [Bacteriovoracaceae bacterium]
MDSSFLTLAIVGLGLYSVIMFFKLIIQFGLPNHPALFTSYLVSFCAMAFLSGKAAVGLNLISPLFWLKWHPLPMVAGSLALLLQTIMTVGNYSHIQQKVVSRFPLIAGLLCFAFFPQYAGTFFGLTIAAGCLFLAISAGKARYQKRLYFKMSFFLGIFGLLVMTQNYPAYVVGEVILYFAAFYFFLFEQSFGVAALMDKGVRK